MSECSLSYPEISHKVNRLICPKILFYDKIYSAEVFVSLYAVSEEIMKE
ncbi:hypothetical protein D081_0351 [Anaerovibrio sp. JC8]|nr:hypothetical protein D081_0351 [Anaerovibrio sp. JC8]